MSKQVRVPIRVRRAGGRVDREVTGQKRAAVESDPAVAAPEPAATRGADGVSPPAHHEETTSSTSQCEEIEALKDDLEEWRDRALRLQAEIENFRKRQRRLAEDRIEADRARLLRNFLMVADDLERALKAEEGSDGTLREGVRVTHRSLRQLLKQEGIEPIEAEGEEFDPVWHEAVGTIPHENAGVARDTVVDVTQSGYRLDGRLLRPARVIVAR